ncbi:PREDICTED: polycomb group RING finger protein 1-like [Ficedula albicollis]|uniref:polycomb group RING finger protein 1-like n=1 Tax=Ficedula albicollis TaxID=59894 RepID=UPI0007AD8CCD|nr:PREDICTED: polycomb group RING finger protein 1-like [Ficedula albicollis]
MASPPQGGPMAIAMRLRNQLQAVYKMDPLRNEASGRQGLWWRLGAVGGQPGPALSDSGPRCVPEPPVLAGEEKRIREFYQSRGLDRVTQPSGDDTVGGDPMGLPYSTFDHSRAHYFRYDEHVSLCLEKLSSSKDKSKAVLQQKYVRCSVRAQIRHLRRVLCHRLGLSLQHVQILFDNEPLPDHMTMKQLWLSRWFGKPAPLLLHYSIKDKRR